MATVVTINRPEVVALIEDVANKFTRGNKTAAVEMALKRLLDSEARTGTLFGMFPGSVRVKPGVDLTQPTFEDEPWDAETTRWAAHLPPEFK